MRVRRVVFRDGLALQAPADYRRDPAYRALRVQLDAAPTFLAALKVLERAAVHPGFLAADLAPTAAWARRFINTAGLGLARPRPSMQRRHAARAVTVIVALLFGHRRRPGRRGAAPPPLDAQRLAATTAHWRGVIAGAGPDLTDRLHAIRIAAASRWPGDRWATHHAALAPLVRKRRETYDLVRQLVAWELGVSMRRTRPPLPIEAVRSA